VYWARQQYKEAITFLLNGLMLLVQLRIEPQTQQAMASDMAGWRAELGEQKFDALWKEITNSPLPEWLLQEGQQQGMTAEQFIAAALGAHYQRRPEAAQYYEAARKLAADAGAPAEVRELGRVLSRLMAGDARVDLSALPREWREAVERARQTIHE
jgi:hypothetical protein